VAVVELSEVLQTNGAVREFEPEPVSDETLYEVLRVARFAPSGGNRQGWRVIVVKDPERRRALRDLYLKGWYEYLAMSAAGLVPWAPVTDRDAERAAVDRADDFRRQAEAGPGGFAEHLDEAPALLLVLGDLRALAAVDRDGDRYTFAGGASVYPFAYNVLLAARDAGLGGVMTTMAVRSEHEVRALFDIPAELAVAALIALGRPRRVPRRLTRRPVEEFTSVDRFDGQPFRPDGG
jgi:nitroreductase